MKKKECPSCAMEIPEDAKVCPICSYEFTESHSKTNKWLAILLIAAFLLSFLYAITSSAQAVEEIKMFFISDWGAGAEFNNDPVEDYYGIYESTDESFTVAPFNWADSLSDDFIAPLFAVKGISSLSTTTEVKGVSVDSLILPGKSVTYSIQKKKYTVFATGFYKKGFIQNYKAFLQLNDGNKKSQQLLFEVDTINELPRGKGYEGGLSVVWVGDLNTDNLLDIIISTANDYRGSEKSLLISPPMNENIVTEVCRYPVSPR